MSFYKICRLVDKKFYSLSPLLGKYCIEYKFDEYIQPNFNDTLGIFLHDGLPLKDNIEVKVNPITYNEVVLVGLKCNRSYLLNLEFIIKPLDFQCLHNIREFYSKSLNIINNEYIASLIYIKTEDNIETIYRLKEMELL